MISDDFEEVTRDSITARRNYLVGLWAGRQLGLSGGDLQAYAASVHAADYEVAGPEDVVRKVSRDLAAADIAVSPDVVLAAVTTSEASARRELLATD